MSTSLRPAPQKNPPRITTSPFVHGLLGRRGAAVVLVLAVLVAGLACALLLSLIHI